MAERAKSRPKAGKGKVKGDAIAKLPKGAKAKIGHNSGRIPDEVYERHLAKIDATAKAMEKAKELFDQAKGVHQSAFKSAKNDGCDIDSIKLARKLHAQDHGVIQVTYANVSRVLTIMKSPLGEEQLNLFGAIEAPAPVVDVALQGQAAGKNGEPMGSNPHTPGSPEFAVWHENWTLGQQQIADSMGSGSGATH